MSVAKLLDGVNSSELTGEFNVKYQPAMIYGENLSGDIALEAKTDTGWIPVLEEGTPVVLSATGTNPLGIYSNGKFRVVAGSLGGTEKVYFDQ